MNGNLSGQQFGSATVQIAEPREPPHLDGSNHPLPLGENTNGSAKMAQVWRKPDTVLPYSAASRGSSFQPV